MMKSTAAPKAEEILDKAIELARRDSWQAFSLAELARELDCKLYMISSHSRSKDDIADALFDRADRAMLSLSDDATFRSKTSNDKLLALIMQWFLSLADIKPMVKDIMAYKFEVGHFHLQAHGVTRVSRTVQWFLCAADRKHSGLARIADEFAVTGAYLASFAVFLQDKSEDHAKTRAFLSALLSKIDQGQQCLTSLSPAASSPKSADKA